MDHASGGWGIVRADWVNHPEVGPDELALLALLSLYANQDDACWPSQVSWSLKTGSPALCVDVDGGSWFLAAWVPGMQQYYPEWRWLMVPSAPFHAKCGRT